MGNPYSGDIYDVPEGVRPQPGHVGLTAEQAEQLKQLPPIDRIPTLLDLVQQRAMVERELPRYKSHKEVHALKIKEVVDPTKPNEETDGSRILIPEDEGYGPFHVGADYVRKHQPSAGGYFVVYKDGYSSFSPAEAFEDGYTRI